MVVVAEPDPAEYAVKTWRYLRLAMVLLVVGLSVAVAVEHRAVRRACMQGSISAYYYTPVRAFFVSALLAIGVCLVALRARRDTEDALLNLAGMFAPVVALVPTPLRGRQCSSFEYALQDREVNVANNVTALLVLGGVALAAGAAFGLWEAYRDRPPSTLAWLGLASAVVLWVLARQAFYGHRTWFLANAHNYAAIAMFACIVVVVVINAVDLGRKRRRERAAAGRAAGKRVYANRYAVVAAAMVGSAVGMFLWQRRYTWNHWVLGVEAALIALFAVFWALQTAELWREGLRDLPAPPAPH